MEPVPVRLEKSGLEVRLTEEFQERLGIELDADEEWILVLATCMEGTKMKYVIALPWFPESGDAKDEELDWFVPTAVQEKDVDAVRWRALHYKPD
jgi:ferredoxin-thioredoxin reductase catalytic subunit